MGSSTLDDEGSHLLVTVVDCESKPQAQAQSHSHPQAQTVIATDYESLPLAVQIPSDGIEQGPTTIILLQTSWDRYNGHLDQWPVLVKSITAFFLLGLGDAMAQAIQHVAGWDWVRSLRFGAFGLLGAPWTHYYYHALDSALPPTASPCSWTTGWKVVIDQFIQAPICLFCIIVGLNIMKGVGIATIRQDIQNHYWSALIVNCKLSIALLQVTLAVLSFFADRSLLHSNL